MVKYHSATAWYFAMLKFPLPSPKKRHRHGCEATNKGAIFEDECKQMTVYWLFKWLFLTITFSAAERQLVWIENVPKCLFSGPGADRSPGWKRYNHAKSYHGCFKGEMTCLRNWKLLAAKSCETFRLYRSITLIASVFQSFNNFNLFSIIVRKSSIKSLL